MIKKIKSTNSRKKNKNQPWNGSDSTFCQPVEPALICRVAACVTSRVSDVAAHVAGSACRVSSCNVSRRARVSLQRVLRAMLQASAWAARRRSCARTATSCAACCAACCCRRSTCCASASRSASPGTCPLIHVAIRSPPAQLLIGTRSSLHLAGHLPILLLLVRFQYPVTHTEEE